MNRGPGFWRLPSLAAAAGLLCFGLWQLGGAAWIHGKAMLAQVLLERAWHERQSGASASEAHPWPWADTAPVARLRVPRLDIDQIVLSGASGRTLAFAPAHLVGTAAPGQRGHTVLSGHRDTHFRFLRDLVPGDIIAIERPDGMTVRYEVKGHEIVDARRARLSLSADRSVASLVTCYPFDAVVSGGPLRYVVSARVIEPVNVTHVVSGSAMETSARLE